MPRSLAAFTLLGYLCSFFALAQPLSDPIVLPGDSTPAAAVERQQRPKIARGANGYLAVWEDNRASLIGSTTSGPYFGARLGSMFDIYAARLDSSGAVIDTAPIVISRAGYNQTRPQVAWNGTHYLVVWMTEREDDRYVTELHAVRVTQDGTIVDSSPIVIAQSIGLAEVIPWSLTSDGSNWTVIWRGLDEAVFTIDAARIAPDGTVLDPGGKRLVRDAWNTAPSNADIAFAGDSYLLVYESLDGFRGRRIDSALVPIGPSFVLNGYAPSTPNFPAVASDGTNYLVVWWEARYYGFSQLMATRVSHAGAVLDPLGIVLTGYADYTNFHPDVMWSGTSYFVAHNYLDDIRLTRVGTNGTVIDATPKVVRSATATQDQVAIAPGAAGGAQLVWNDNVDLNDVHTASVTSSAVPSTASVVSLGAPRHSLPRMVSAGSEYLIVFRSETSTATRILAHRLTAAGLPLAAEPIEVATGTKLTNPAVAWNGTHYLVVWENLTEPKGRIYGRRLTAAGVPAGDAVPLIPGNTPDVAALGSAFLVVDTYEPIDHNRFTQAVRVSADGVPVGSAIPFLSNFDVWPRVSAAGSRWLVVWEQNATHDNSSSRIMGAFVAADGAATAPFAISDGGVDDTPHLAAGPDSTLVTWAENDILGRRIQPDGTLLDSAAGFVVAAAPEKQWTPSIAWDGTGWVVDFLDHRNEAYPTQPEGDVYAARVSAAGVPAASFAVAAQPLPEETPSVAASGGTSVFSYAALHVPQGNLRLFVRSSACCPTPGTLSLGSAALSAGEGAGSISVPVVRSGGSSGAVSVSLTTSDGTAGSPGDYAGGSVTVAFSDAESGTKVVDIALAPDPLDEFDESFNVTLSSPTGGATLGTIVAATASIIDDDEPPLLNVAGGSAMEGGTVQFLLTLSGTSGKPISVAFATSNGTATAGTDYIALSGTAQLAAGSLSVSVPVVTLSDTAVEPDETFSLGLSAPSNVTLAGSTAQGTITAPPLQLTSVSPTSVAAGGGTVVTVTGSGFTTGTTVTIGGIDPVALSVVSASTIEVTVPALPAGTLQDLSVSDGASTDSIAAALLVDFSDVSGAHPFHSFIETIARRGITNGCAPGAYCPGAAVMRDQMSIFLLRGEHGGGYAPPPATGTVFADVAAERFAAGWIEQLYSEGITAGCAVNPLRYCPAEQVTRAQMALFLLRAVSGSSYTPPPATGIFADVPVGSQFAAWIEELYRRGITSGCATDPLRFCPSASNTRGEMAVFLVRAFSLQP